MLVGRASSSSVTLFLGFWFLVVGFQLSIHKGGTMRHQSSGRNGRYQGSRATRCNSARHSASLYPFTQDVCRQGRSWSHQGANRRSQPRALYKDQASHFHRTRSHFLTLINGLCSRGAIFHRRASRRSSASLARCVRNCV